MSKINLIKRVICLTWVSSNRCVACSSYTLATICFLVTLDLLGLTLVSLLHQSITCETVALSAHSFLVNASTWFHLFTLAKMFIGFVLSTLPNALILTTSFFTTTFNKTPLHANFFLDCTPFTRSSLFFNP